MSYSHLCLRRTLPSAKVALLSDRELDALALRQRNPRLVAITNDKNISDTRREGTIKRVLHMNDIEATNVLLTVHNYTSTTHVTSASNRHEITGVEVNEVSNLVLHKIELDCVVRLDGRVRIADCATIMGDNIRHALVAESDFANLAKLVYSLLRSNAMDGKTTLDIVQETEILARAFNRNNIHETGWVGVVSADLAINFNQALMGDFGHLAVVEGILKTVTEEDCEGKGFAEFVRAR